mgnify:CR=1 FL=1
MFYLLIGILLLILLIYVGQNFVQANPADLARQLRTSAGVALLILAGVLTLTGRFAFVLGSFPKGQNNFLLQRLSPTVCVKDVPATAGSCPGTAEF